MSISNGFTRLGSIIIGIVLVAIYWLVYTHFVGHFRPSDLALFRVFGLIVIADGIWICTMQSPYISNALFWIAILIWLALFIWMGATGAQGAVGVGLIVGV